MKRLLHTVLFALLLAGAAGLLSGCATDSDDIDYKPWLPPQQWEEMGPFPSTFGQGH
jgi:hypothetical protein